ncbi:MAG: DUF4832 domain-containing protein [Limisphaerales bacterium]
MLGPAPRLPTSQNQARRVAEVTFRSHTQSGKPIPITWHWLNDGVAPLYEPCEVAIAFLDEKDQVVQKQWLTESHPKQWMPDAISTETVSATFSGIPSGKYQLAVGLFLDPKEEKPVYRLGIRGRTPQGWYILNLTFWRYFSRVLSLQPHGFPMVCAGLNCANLG